MITYRELAPHLAAAKVDAWLVYDFRGTNPVFERLVGQRFFLTRRAFLLLPPDKSPTLLISRVDATEAIASLPGVVVQQYTTWKDLGVWLTANVGAFEAVAMEYSPHGELPAMSWVDGGTLDIVRALGVRVEPSAELFQAVAAAWTPDTLASHKRAMAHIVAIKDGAFARIAGRLSAGLACTEYDVQRHILNEYARLGLVTDDPPIVAVNAHSGNPHYEPSADDHASIEPGDWVLIDLWAKETASDAVFADITWVGYVGRSVPARHLNVFDAVAQARDAVIEYLSHHSRLHGFELDRVARESISSAGYAEYFVHRTGHSLSPGPSVHGIGANLDDFETHDARVIADGLGFTVEPGIYLPEFGVRSEINVYMSSDGPIVTSPVQTTPVTIGG